MSREISGIRKKKSSKFCGRETDKVPWESRGKRLLTEESNSRIEEASWRWQHRMQALKGDYMI